MELSDIVSKNLIYLRTSRKMTQLELGEALQYSDKAVSKWERGEAVPDAYVLKQIAQLFEVSVDYILTAHDKDDIKAVAKNWAGRRDIISLIAFLGAWTLGIVIFVALRLAGIYYWLTLVYTLPVSMVVLVVMTAVWGKGKTNIFNISLLIWSIILAFYLAFLDRNWWYVFTVGIPAQIIVLLSAIVKFKK